MKTALIPLLFLLISCSPEMPFHVCGEINETGVVLKTTGLCFYPNGYDIDYQKLFDIISLMEDEIVEREYLDSREEVQGRYFSTYVELLPNCKKEPGVLGVTEVKSIEDFQIGQIRICLDMNKIQKKEKEWKGEELFYFVAMHEVLHVVQFTLGGHLWEESHPKELFLWRNSVDLTVFDKYLKKQEERILNESSLLD